MYEVKETKSPAGYILTNDSEFYIRISDEGIKLLAKQDRVAPKNWQTTAVVYGDIKTFTATVIGETQTKDALAVIENTPGAVLPNTGGSGTTIFYMIGLLLTSFAGTGILMKRRKRNAA